MAFSHILITRPSAEGVELAQRLSTHPAEVLVMPAYEFKPSVPFADQLKLLREASAGAARPLVIFTSPRAVEHGLSQLPAEALARCRAAAIGPTTVRMLREAGVTVALQAEQGHTSEDLLAVVPGCDSSAEAGAREAFILTAPGGRSALADGLRRLGYRPHLLLVYERKPAELAAGAVAALREAASVLSVWTSAESIHALSQRLPGECWNRLCAGHWLVISERLARVARSFHPAQVHLASGPTNEDLAAAIQALD
jgi:uroporphyrinogen-III synthase